MSSLTDKRYWYINPFKALNRLLVYFIEGRQATQRLQWLNIFVRPLLQLFARFTFIIPRSYRPDVYLVVGLGRSGSSTLSKYISLLPDTLLLNEPKLLFSMINSNDDIMNNYSYNSSKPCEGKVNKKYWKVLHLLSYLSRSKRVVIKYPELLYSLDLYKEHINAKVVFLVRNPLEYMYSVENWNKRHRRISNKTDESWWGKNFFKLVALINISEKEICFNAFETLLDRELAEIEWNVAVEYHYKYEKNFQLKKLIWSSQIGPEDILTLFDEMEWNLTEEIACYIRADISPKKYSEIAIKNSRNETIYEKLKAECCNINKPG